MKNLTPIDIYEDVLNVDQYIRLSFLIFYDPSVTKFFIKSLDFSVDSEGETVKDCIKNIQEAIRIHIEDCGDGETIFDPAPHQYWEQFIQLKIIKEQKQPYFVLKNFLDSLPVNILKYA